MTLVEIARIYTDLVNLDDQIPPNEHIAKDEVSVLRSRYHDMLMDRLQAEGIEFVDRFDATRKAFEIVKKEERINIAKTLLEHQRKTGT